MFKKTGSQNGTPTKQTKKKDETDGLRTKKKAEDVKLRNEDDDVISLMSQEDSIDSDPEPGSPSIKSLILELKAETEVNSNEFGLFKVEVRSRFDAIDAHIKNLNRSKSQPENLTKATKSVPDAKQPDTNLEEELARQLVQNTNLNTEIMKQKKENALQDTEIRRMKEELQKYRDRYTERKLLLEDSYRRMRDLRSQLDEATSNTSGRYKGEYFRHGTHQNYASHPATRSRTSFEDHRGYRGSKKREMSADYDYVRHERQESFDEHRSSQKRRSRSPRLQSNDRDKLRRQGQNENSAFLRPTESKLNKSSNYEEKLRRPKK